MVVIGLWWTSLGTYSRAVHQWAGILKLSQSGSSLGDLNWEGQRVAGSWQQELKLMGHIEEARREGCSHVKSWPTSHEIAETMSWHIQ